jgi:hypothetical protein
MGFHIDTIVMPSISKGAHRQIFGQVMDINYLTWIFGLGCCKIMLHVLPLV